MGVGLHLFGAASPGDHSRDGREREDPLERELRQRGAGWYQGTEPFDGLEPSFVVDPRERLTAVEHRALTVEEPVIPFGEGARAGELAAQKSAGQRHPRDDRHVPPQRLLEEQLRRPEPEGVEDDLHRLDIRILDRLEGFLHLLDAHAVEADLPGLHEPVEGLEDLRAVIDLRRRAVELDEVEAVDGEVRQAAVDEGREIRGVVAVGGVRGEPAASLRDDMERLRPFAAEARNQALGEAVAVDVGGIEEVDAGVEGCMERGKRGVLVGASPLAATDGPGAEADLRNIPPRPTESACVHDG